MQCKLCSSTDSLLCLYGGKRKLFRTYIRDITNYTVGVKFKEDELFKYICYTCIIQVYNIYVFKVLALENERKLRAVHKEAEHLRDADSLPNISELKEQFVPWLLSKADVGSGRNDTKDKTEEIAIQTDISSMKMIDSSTQCYQTLKGALTQTNLSLMEMLDKCTQCDLQEDKSWQNISTQMSPKKFTTESSQIDSDLIIKFNVFAQTDTWSQSDIETQTPTIEYRTAGTQTAIGSRRKNGYTNNQMNKVNNGVKKKVTPKTTSANVNTISSSLQCNFYLTTESKTQKNFNTRIINTTKDKSVVTTPVSSAIPIEKSDLCHGDDKPECEKKFAVGFDMNMVKKRENIDLNDSKELCITTDANQKPLVETFPPYCLSPRSSGLLSIKKTVQYVRICSYCDCTLYSVKEWRTHWRKHRKCVFCQKTFTGMKKLNIHMIQECEKRSLPEVSIVPLEKSKEIAEKFPSIVEDVEKEKANGTWTSKRQKIQH